MNFYDIAFYCFAALTLFSAGIMVFARNVIYSAVGLLFTFCGVAGLYVLLAADFVAVVQVLIYVGGILVLLIFGVMLSNKVTSVDVRSEAIHLVPAILAVAGVVTVLLRVVVKTRWAEQAVTEFTPTTSRIGILLMTDFLIPFEIVSMLLLGALIGAAFVARKD